MRLILLCFLSAFLVYCQPKPDSSDEGGDTSEIAAPNKLEVGENGTDAPIEDPKGDSLTPTPTPSPIVDPAVGVTGTLAIDLGLTAAGQADKVLAFSLVNGEMQEHFDLITVDVDQTSGDFAIDLPTTNRLLETLESAANADGTYDREVLAEFFGSDIDGATDAEIKEYADEQRALAAKLGGPSYVLVSMVSGADRVAEAQSFRFIGLKSGEGDFINIPASSAKGDIDLGDIESSGDSATSTVEASDDIFSLSNATLMQLAATDDPLKGIKNNYMNSDDDGVVKVSTDPFFAWNAEVNETLADFSPATIDYVGYGIYMRARDVAGLTFNALCNGTGGRKIIELIPPAAITDSNAQTFDDDRPFSNAASGNITGTSTDRVECQDSVDSLYVATEGDQTAEDVLWNWGAGGALLGDIPPGIWRLTFDGDLIANFDMAASMPIRDGNPTVFIPRVKVEKNDTTNEITGVSVKFAIWTPDGFVDLSSTEALERTVSDLQIEFDDQSGTTSNGGARTAERMGLEAATGGVYHGLLDELDSTWKFAYDVSTDVPVAGTISFSYKMYGNSYRFEYRENN